MADEYFATGIKAFKIVSPEFSMAEPGLCCRLSQKKPPVYFTLGVVMAAGEK